jgi:hypothetical protein
MARSKTKQVTTGKRGANARPLVRKMPQSKAVAAVQAGMFLHTDDAWSLAYFDPNDLHSRERELFAKDK